MNSRDSFCSPETHIIDVSVYTFRLDSLTMYDRGGIVIIDKWTTTSVSNVVLFAWCYGSYWRYYGWGLIRTLGISW